jgi:hypothetical protein
VQTALNPRFFKLTVLQKTTGRGRRLIHKKQKNSLKTGERYIWTNEVNNSQTAMLATSGAQKTPVGQMAPKAKISVIAADKIT